MKVPAVVFLFALLSTAFAAVEDLIPFDDFSISVPLTDTTNPQGLRVEVHVNRNRVVRVGGTSIYVFGPKLPSATGTLEPEKRVSLTKTCEALLKDLGYRNMFLEKTDETRFEAESMGGPKYVSLYHGSSDFIAPEEVPRLKEALEQTAAAEAWYQLLLRAGTLPEKTAKAHPPKAVGYRIQATLGRVQGEDLEYRVNLRRSDYIWIKPYYMEHQMVHASHVGKRRTILFVINGEWVKPMMEQVVLALEAVEKREAFAYSSPVYENGDKYTVTANLATQKADLTADTEGVDRLRMQEQCSFAVTQLAELRAVKAQSEARAKWFAEHEGWFFEGSVKR